jgi:hypothetical protein
MASRVGRSALPMCGVSSARSLARSASGTMGSRSYTSSPAAARRPSASASASASSSTHGPRAVFTTTAPGRIRASRSRESRPRVASFKGQHRQRISLVAQSSSSVAKAAPSARSTASSARRRWV